MATVTEFAQKGKKAAGELDVLSSIGKALGEALAPALGTIHWLNYWIEQAKDEKLAIPATLNPGLAAELTRPERNPDNRGIRTTKLTQYASDIRAGLWADNGEPIILSREGLLNDGQHRCLAVIDANLSIPAMFAFGYDRSTRVTLDQGAARAAGDYLGMESVPNATVQASLARVLIGFERSGNQAIGGAAYVTNADVLARVHADDQIARSATFASGHSKKTRKFAAPAIIGFCHYVFHEISPVEASAYMEQLCGGENLKARDPAYTVRERLLALESKAREPRIHLIFRGWNAFRQGRELKLAKIVGDQNIPAAV